MIGVSDRVPGLTKRVEIEVEVETEIDGGLVQGSFVGRAAGTLLGETDRDNLDSCQPLRHR